MFRRTIALVSLDSGIPFTDLEAVAKAIQIQVSEHFLPAWRVVDATIVASPSLDHAAALDDAWPIVIRDSPQLGNQFGVHDVSGEIMALVRPVPGWSRIVSHECLEMLGDPFGTSLITAPSRVPGQGMVRYLMEVCDPCQQAGYLIDQIEVCDFCLPDYFRPATGSTTATSYQESLHGPWSVIPGGCLNWVTADGVWWQLNDRGIDRLGSLTSTSGNVRSMIYGWSSPLRGARRGGAKRIMAHLQRVGRAAQRARRQTTTRRTPLPLRLAGWQAMINTFS